MGLIPHRDIVALALATPALAIVVALLVAPLVNMADISLHREEFGDLLPGRSLDQYRAIVFDADYLRLFRDTFFYAILVTMIAALLAYPVALHLVTASARWRPVLYFLVAAPLLVNAIVRTYGWLLILGRVGILNTILRAAGLIGDPLALTGNATGMVIGGVEVFLPFMILSLVAALAKVEPGLLDAASVLGATRWQRFRTIVLPLTWPGLATGAILVFTLMIGAFVTPLILGGTAIKFLSVTIFADALVLFNLSRATALAMLLLVVLAAATALRAALRHSRAARP